MSRIVQFSRAADQRRGKWIIWGLIILLHAAAILGPLFYYLKRSPRLPGPSGPFTVSIGGPSPAEKPGTPAPVAVSPPAEPQLTVSRNDKEKPASQKPVDSTPKQRDSSVKKKEKPASQKPVNASPKQRGSSVKKKGKPASQKPVNASPKKRGSSAGKNGGSQAEAAKDKRQTALNTGSKTPKSGQAVIENKSQMAPKEVQRPTEPRVKPSKGGVFAPDRSGPIGYGPAGVPGNHKEPEIPQNYFEQLKHYFYIRWQQPPRSLLGNRNQEAVVEVTVAADGQILASRIIRASGIKAMDQSVRQLLDNLNPLPPPRVKTTFQLKLRTNRL